MGVIATVEVVVVGGRVVVVEVLEVVVEVEVEVEVVVVGPVVLEVESAAGVAQAARVTITMRMAALLTQPGFWSQRSLSNTVVTQTRTALTRPWDRRDVPGTLIGGSGSPSVNSREFVALCGSGNLRFGCPAVSP